MARSLPGRDDGEEGDGDCRQLAVTDAWGVEMAELAHVLALSLSSMVLLPRIIVSCARICMCLLTCVCLPVPVRPAVWISVCLCPCLCLFVCVCSTRLYFIRAYTHSYIMCT